MTNAWGVSWGGNTGAWLTSWGSSAVAAVERPLIRVAIPDGVLERKGLPWHLDREKVEARIAKKLAKRIDSPESVQIAAQLVKRMEGVLLATTPGDAALALSASKEHTYDLEEIKRIRAYWANVERLVKDAIEEEELLWLLN